MTGPYDDDPRLTSEQEAVVGLPVTARTLVVAGAGTGKTHTLVRRLDTLMAQDEAGADDTLVLSFSRAAVRELSERLARQAKTARYVRARTFDSWALELLLELDPDGYRVTQGFDERIRAATDLICDGGVRELYPDLRHVIIDEVQDLVGSRREMVEALLDHHTGGFTVVGDPAQAIYGFQVVDPAERKTEDNRFFQWLRRSFDEELRELRLTRDFRAQTEEAMTALAFGPRLQAGTKAAGQESYRDLRAALLDTLLVSDLDDELVRGSLREREGTTAILCRSNGQALLVAERLHAGGVPHRLQRSARDRTAPAWLGPLFQMADGSLLTESRFHEVLENLPIPGEMDHDGLWDMLLRTGRGRGQALDLVRLRSAIANGGLPDELTAQPRARLVVSSVHRAKGLEFDRVIVVDPGPLDEGGTAPIDPTGEARTLYVALTRPRQELMHLRPIQITPLYLRNVSPQQRRGLYHMRKRDLRLGFELIGGDVHTKEPAGSHSVIPGAWFGHTALELQHLLVGGVSSGDQVILKRLDGKPSEGRRSPTYVILHKAHRCAIGVVSESFTSDLHMYMRTFRRHEPTSWPRTIDGLSIDTVETVTGSASAGSMTGLGAHGVWVAPRLVGLGRFTYDKATATEESDRV